MLAFGPKDLATGRNDAYLRRFMNDGLRQRCHRVDQVLAAIEDQQDLPMAKVFRDAGGRIARFRHQSQRGGDDVGDIVEGLRNPRSRKKMPFWNAPR